MAKTKVREISLTTDDKGFFFFKKGSDKLDFSDLSSFRHLLSNEKARLLHIIKTNKPESIYDLAKKSGRTFKSVFEDIKLLERFGFVELLEHKKNNRKLLKPVISADSITIHIHF